MRVLVLSEYVPHRPWSPDRWAVLLAGALRSRGHDITFACDGCEEPADLIGFEPLIRRPARCRSKRQPLRFSRWAKQTRCDVPHDASVSFTPLAPGDVWAPIGPTEVGRARALVQPNLLSSGLDVVGRPWLASGVAASLMARLQRNDARRYSLGRSGDDSGGLGFCGSFAGPPTNNREETRAALGLEPDEVAALVSAVSPGSTGIENLLSGLQMMRSRSAAKTPTLVVATRGQLTVLRLAERFGVGDFVRIIGPVRDIGALLGACDAAVAPRAGGPTSTGRFIADALVCGTPVLCVPDAPGAELLTGEPAPGMVLPGSVAPEWRTALERLSDRAWLATCTDAASTIGDGLTVGLVAERLEVALAGCGEKRPHR